MTLYEPFLLNCDIDESHSQKVQKIEAKLVTHAERLRFKAKLRNQKQRTPLSKSDRDKIHRRAERLVSRGSPHLRSSKHLKSAERSRLQTVSAGAEVRSFPTSHRIDEIISSLFVELPWFASALKLLHRDLHAFYERENRIGFRPMILVGPSGIGKTHLAYRLSQLTDLPDCVIDVSTASDGFRVAGMTRAWANSEPGRPLETILDTKIKNPIVIIDEICKAGTIESSNGTTTSAVHALLGLVEPKSSQLWECPFFKLPFDMSKINWIMTANEVDSIPVPLKTRCRIICLDGMTVNDLMRAAYEIGRRRNLSPEAVASLEPLLNAYPASHVSLNLRTLNRLIDGLEAVECRPAMH